MVTAAAISILALTILMGILTNRSDSNALRTQLDGVRGEVNGVRGEVNGVRGEVNAVRGEINGVRGEVNGLRGQITGFRDLIDDLKESNHRDALEIMRQMTALHERVAVVESQVNRRQE